MFPMRGFRRDFPFVTPAVTWQVRHAPMFRECVAMSAFPQAGDGYLARCLRRHIAVTLPAYGLEALSAGTYACSTRHPVSAYRGPGRGGPGAGKALTPLRGTTRGRGGTCDERRDRAGRRGRAHDL